MRTEKYCTPARIAGVGMVEVLVALVVLGVGMLGTATLYVSALQAKTTALSRMQAINLAYDMADRIRANRTAGSGYAIATLTAAATPTVNCVETTASPAVSCTPAQMATSDLYLWSDLVTHTLPGNVDGSVSVGTAINPRTYTITLNWSEPGSGALSYALQVQI